MDRDRPPDELNLSAICLVTGLPTVVFAATACIFHGRIEAHVAPIVIDVVVGVIIAVVLASNLVFVPVCVRTCVCGVPRGTGRLGGLCG